MSYHGHQRRPPASSGKIISLSEQSLYLGAGASAVGSATPVHTGREHLDPAHRRLVRAAGRAQRVRRARFHAQATANEILLDVATLCTSSCWATSRSSRPSASRSRRCTTSSTSPGISPRSAWAATLTPTGPFRSGSGAGPLCSRPRRRWRSRRPGWPTGSISTRGAARSRRRPAGRRSTLVDLGTPQRELLQVALRQRPDIAAQNRRDRRGRGPLQAGNRQAALAHALAGLQRRRLRRRQQPRSAARRQLRRPDRLRRPRLLDAAQHGRGQPLADQGAPRSHRRDRPRATGGNDQPRPRRSRAPRWPMRGQRRNRWPSRGQELASAELGFKEDLERSRQNLGRPIEVLNSLTLLAEARVNLIRALCIMTRLSSPCGSRWDRRRRLNTPVPLRPSPEGSRLNALRDGRRSPLYRGRHGIKSKTETAARTCRSSCGKRHRRSG